MFHVSKFKTRGFTLTELIIYVALVGILLTAASIFARDILYGNVKSQVKARVQSEGRFAMERVSQEIRKANRVEALKVDGIAYDLKGVLLSGWGGSYTGTIITLARDSNGIIYIGGSSGKFGKYDPVTEIFVDLTSRIASFWGTQNVLTLLYDPADQAIYLGGGTNGTQFAKYNITTDTATSLVAKLNFWGGTNVGIIVLDARDSANRVLYIGGGYQGAKLGKCPINTCVNGVSNASDFSAKLNVIDPYNSGTGTGISWIKEMVFDSANGDLYLTTNNGRFERCSISSCVDGGSNFSGTLTSKISAIITGEIAMTFDVTNSVFYFGRGYPARFVKCALTNCVNGASNATDLTAKVSFNGIDQVIVANTPIPSVYIAGETGGGGPSPKFMQCLITDCANGSANAIDLTSKIPATWTNGIKQIFFDPGDNILYLGGGNAQFVKYNLDCHVVLPDGTRTTIALNGDGGTTNTLQMCSKSGAVCSQANSWTSLHSSDIETTAFACGELSSGTSLGEEAVKINLTLKAKNPSGKPEFDAQSTMETSISLRL